MKALLLILIILNAYSFEVNTHQAITQCAIENIKNECNKQGASNLHKFVENMELSSIDYTDAKFEKYNETYINYAKSKDDFKKWNISFNNKGNYKDLIEAGSILEDSLYHNHDVINLLVKKLKPDGRFNNHFYSVQKETNPHFEAPDWYVIPDCLKDLKSCYLYPSSDSLGSRALTWGYGTRVDNITWALDKNVNLANSLGTNRKNDYDLHDAFTYFVNSFEGNSSIRKTNQAKLFVSLGFVVHMLQDLHSPAHVRDNTHPYGSYLEVFNRFRGGFRVVNGRLDTTNIHPNIMSAVKDMNTSIMLGGYRGNKNSSYEDFFQKEANWVSLNFFSGARYTAFDFVKDIDRKDIELDNTWDSHTIFDRNHPKPRESDIGYRDSLAPKLQLGSLYQQSFTKYREVLLEI